MDQSEKLKARPGHFYPKSVDLSASLALCKLNNPKLRKEDPSLSKALKTSSPPGETLFPLLLYRERAPLRTYLAMCVYSLTPNRQILFTAFENSPIATCCVHVFPLPFNCLSGREKESNEDTLNGKVTEGASFICTEGEDSRAGGDYRALLLHRSRVVADPRGIRAERVYNASPPQTQ